MAKQTEPKSDLVASSKSDAAPKSLDLADVCALIGPHAAAVDGAIVLRFTDETLPLRCSADDAALRSLVAVESASQSNARGTAEHIVTYVLAK
jgi:hypothetical protein